MNNAVPVAKVGSNWKIKMSTGVTTNPPPIPKAAEMIPTNKANIINSPINTGGSGIDADTICFIFSYRVTSILVNSFIQSLIQRDT